MLHSLHARAHTQSDTHWNMFQCSHNRNEHMTNQKYQYFTHTVTLSQTLTLSEVVIAAHLFFEFFFKIIITKEKQKHMKLGSIQKKFERQCVFRM